MRDGVLLLGRTEWPWAMPHAGRKRPDSVKLAFRDKGRMRIRIGLPKAT